ncbi:hypothetical protein NDU88_004146 [Pleurodeles waltl]|uniref:Uncharacterized protein n=1 Tax=Pleurodeles waltl TaxID=8319 RepID=A0AAV7T8H8_PLEWA|nr:hypothetical protein NDU88_004146 [Pleurodeles waltl]
MIPSGASAWLTSAFCPGREPGHELSRLEAKLHRARSDGRLIRLTALFFEAKQCLRRCFFRRQRLPLCRYLGWHERNFTAYICEFQHGRNHVREAHGTVFDAAHPT